jgi:hypothetical protein
VLRRNRMIDLVLVICPVAARAVWGDRELGQVKLYSWLPARVVEFHAKEKELWSDVPVLVDGERPELTWVVTNYDFVRVRKHLDELLKRLLRYKSVMLVLDESSALGSHTSQQSKAIAEIRKLCSRCVMLNGTPGEPPKLWSQFNILDPRILSRYKSFTTFKWQYAQWGPGQVVPVKGKNGAKGGLRTVHPQTGWKNLDRLSRILAPHCLRRERNERDCPGIRTVGTSYSVREVALSTETWRMYKQLRREAVIELEKDELYVSPNAGVRLMRLAQITSGHLGGFEDQSALGTINGQADDERRAPFAPVRDFSSEKIDWLAEHLAEWSVADCVVVWTRWVRERERLAEKLRAKSFLVYELHGGQKRDERREAEMIFADGGAHFEKNGRRRAMLAQPQAGGIALDMSAATEVYRLSNDYNLKTLEQSDDRPLGPAQQADVVPYTDVVATGPGGERTIDHVIVAALRAKKSIARMTVSEWRKELEEE